MILSLHLIKFPDVIYILSRYCPSIIGELQLLTSINKSISGNWGDHYHLWELAQVLNLIWGLYRHLTRFTVVPLALSSQRHRFLAVKALVVILFLCNSWLLLFRVRAIALQFLPRFTPLSAQSYGRRLSLHFLFHFWIQGSWYSKSERRMLHHDSLWHQDDGYAIRFLGCIQYCCNNCHFCGFDYLCPSPNLLAQSN